MVETRRETDALGSVQVPAHRYWGAQTQRSIENFDIGRDRFIWGQPVIHALGVVKQAAAQVNHELGELPADVAQLIVSAAGEVVDGSLDEEFPLVVFQTGSGTQTNMNANEVIANRAIELAGGVLGSKHPVHPNDHVNRGQSSNDVFPTAAHVAVVVELADLAEAVTDLRQVLAIKAVAFADIVKVGRTHLQDATPITLGQEIGGWVAQLDFALDGVRRADARARALAIGATAVGTGLGTHPEFGRLTVQAISAITGIEFHEAANRFAALAADDSLIEVSATLRCLGAVLMKIANDIRWLASGPRNGLGELIIPANEPGSSMMPGKVNPTQSEALTMVVTRVYGNDATVGFAGSQGNFQLNVFKPVMAHAVLESIRLLRDAGRSFSRHCAAGIEPDRQRIADNLSRNLMLVTALTRRIGYDNAAAIARRAHEMNTSLREAAIASGLVSADQFDTWVVPGDLTRPSAVGPG